MLLGISRVKGGFVRSRIRNVVGTYWPYVVLAVVIMGPLLTGGYILTLDMVFGPNITIPSATTASFAFYAALKAVSFIIPVWVLQVALLFGIFVLSGVGMHRLIASMRPEQSEDWTIAAYFAGILFVVNPFVYSRFMAGQFAVLLGYMLLPFITKAFIQLYKEPSKEQAIRVGLYGTLIGIVSIHTLGLVALIALVTAAFFVRKNYKHVLTYASIAIALFVVLSSYWIVPFAMGSSDQSQQVAAFTGHDKEVFATDSSTLGAIGNVFALHGFWGDSKGLYQTPQDIYTWWLAPIIALWFVVSLGAYMLWRKRPREAYVFLGLLLVAVVVAAGPYASVTGSLYTIIDYLPFFGGYREPQKFVGLIVLVYGVFGAWGVAAILRYMRTYWRSSEPLAIGCLLLIPVFSASLMLWGFKGQVMSASYPKDWYLANSRIPRDTTVLYLPWHHYMRYDFAGRIIASPAAKFFDANMVYSNDPELRGVQYSQTQIQKAIQNNVIPAITDDQRPVAGDLARLGIEYIIVVKEHDYMQYDSLRYDRQLSKIQDSQYIVVYKIRNR